MQEAWCTSPAFVAYGTAVTEGFLAVARGDTVLALRRFIEALRYPGEIQPRSILPDSVCPVSSCPGERVELARLLSARGRDREAATLLDWTLPQLSPGSPSEVLWALEHGRVHERLQNRDAAIEAYSHVITWWRNPDPELLPIVEAARAGLQRLLVERRQ